MDLQDICVDVLEGVKRTWKDIDGGSDEANNLHGYSV